ncbi:MAG: hypothetical protein JO202_06135 [Ktedonobacteraceae bacterium]|nr:hypothetical protein [Ktedonobacteraceae bacterium]
MHAQDIEMYLADLGQELRNQGIRQPVRILMIGGAFMLTQIHNRPTTNDVDVLLKDIEHATTSSLYQTFRAAARVVSNRNHLPNSWINDVIGDFLRDTGAVPEGILWRRYAALEVYVPPSEYILALKLLAGRQKDQRDIQALCQLLHIRTRQQAHQLIDRYIPNRQVQQTNALDEKLDNLFP